jgi:alpha-ketoglutarate-dependent 2,4-dichlorophenoxyacetate dioxygenase
MAITTAPLTITPIHPHFGAEIGGVDLARPVDDEIFARIRAAFEEHSVLVFRDQRLSDQAQMAFSVKFGPLETTTTSIAQNRKVAAEIADLSNVDPDGALIPMDDRRMVYHSGNQLWHTDSSFKRVPALASLLSGREVPPEGGETEFASMRWAWQQLAPEEQRMLEGKVAVHSFGYSRGLVAPGLLTPEQEAALPPVRQALVRANPVNGRKSVYVGSHCWYIEGLSVEESRPIIDRLTALATRPDNVYTHRWRQHDLVMWDTRCMLHRGRPWDGTRFRRVMHRTTVAGDGPTA